MIDAALFPEYSARVLELFRAPLAAGPLPPGAGVRWRGRAGGRSQGAEVVFEARVEHERVVAARFGVFGCPHLLAAASLAASRMTGRSVAEARRVDARALAAELGVPAEKLGRLLVVEDAAAALATTAPDAD
jgi:NifU-like protein involved in Fe-S cluster formation